jgi:hypothetical protein
MYSDVILLLVTANRWSASTELEPCTFGIFLVNMKRQVRIDVMGVYRDIPSEGLRKKCTGSFMVGSKTQSQHPIAWSCLLQAAWAAGGSRSFVPAGAGHHTNSHGGSGWQPSRWAAITHWPGVSSRHYSVPFVHCRTVTPHKLHGGVPFTYSRNFDKPRQIYWFTKMVVF